MATSSPARLSKWWLTSYKRIRAVRFVDAIPRTPAGKILRRVLIAQERQAV